MKNSLYAIAILMLFAACGESNPIEGNTKTESAVANDSIVDPAELVEVTNGHYVEYYPGKKNIKFEGQQDENGKRHGRWVFFSESGEEMSMTMYKNGDKHGHSIVKYPNGGIRYMGEYQNNAQVGIWKSYDLNGELTEEKDYGSPEK